MSRCLGSGHGGSEPVHSVVEWLPSYRQVSIVVYENVSDAMPGLMAGQGRHSIFGSKHWGLCIPRK